MKPSAHVANVPELIDRPAIPWGLVLLVAVTLLVLAASWALYLTN